MRIQDFPKTVAQLARQDVKWVGGEIDSLEYRLAGEGLVQQRYFGLRGTVFVVRVLSPEHFRVSIDGERYEDAFTLEQIPVVLSGAFDRACIRSGIESASATFNDTGQEENLTRPRLAANSTAFDRFQTAGEDDGIFERRPDAPSTAFDRFHTSGEDDGIFDKRPEAPSTAFDRFQTAGEDDAIFDKRPEAPSTAFDRFKSVEQE